MELEVNIWCDFINILSEFGYILKEKNNNIENQRYVWEIIINIKENMKEEIEQAIRMNLNLCYILEEERQIKKINSELFKLNSLLDHNIYRLDNEAYKGISSFHKLVLSTYGNIEKFICELRLVKENISFIRKRKDQNLISRYNYLNKITLPLRGYEELRIGLLTILKKFAELKIIITNPVVFNDFTNDIDVFIKRYKKIYMIEHNNFHQRLNDFYNNLYNLPEYKALKCLSNIEVINVAYNLKPIKKYIDTFFPEQCTNNRLDDFLENHVKCHCGYNIGEPLAIPSLTKIKPMLRKGIVEYIEKIQNERFRPLFDNYLNYNQKSSIINLLEFKTDKINGNIKYINSKLIEEINEALSNTYPLKISIDELAPHLSGTYPIHQLHLLTKDIEKNIIQLIHDKTKGMEKIKQENIIINLVF
ncbi:MAG: hypothetical protein ACOC2J_00200 [bacterium]